MNDQVEDDEDANRPVQDPNDKWFYGFGRLNKKEEK